MQDVRQCGVNLNYWWPVAYKNHLTQSGLHGIKIADVEIVIVQSKDGAIQAYEDACPHKRVRLSKMGKLMGDQLRCLYHGWQFNSSDGVCTSLDSMPGQERCFDLKTFPVKEYGGWIWVFPGDPALAEERELPNIPPANQPEQYYRLPMEGQINCHFSYITENATDLYHAELHKAQQPWANPKLVSLTEDERTVLARYEVETPHLMASMFTGSGKQKFILVRYEYPYAHIYEEDGGFYLFVTYLPQDPQYTRVLPTFYFRHMLPFPWLSKLFLPFVEPLLLPLLNQGTFKKVFREDITAVEEEQRAYNLHGQDLSRDTNPASHAVRRVIINQTKNQANLKQEPLIERPGCPL